MAPPIAAQGYWQTGVRLPVVRSAPDGGRDTVCTSRCAVRPVALYARSSQPKQMPSSEDVLITKQASSHSSAHGSADGVALLRRQVFTFWDFQCLLNAASQLPSPETVADKSRYTAPGPSILGMGEMELPLHDAPEGHVSPRCKEGIGSG